VPPPVDPPVDPVPEQMNIETASPDQVLGQATVPLEPPHTAHHSHKAPPPKAAAPRRAK
jgi:hypothetical protein